MTPKLRLLSLVLLVAAGLAPASAQVTEPAHFVFVFHKGKDTAEVFDGASLTRLGSPIVGFGAFRAFGLPGSNDTGAAAKFYVLSPRAVRVLDGGFHEVATIPLSRPALPDRQGAAMSSDGSTLLVATAAGVYLIDTASDAVREYLPAGFQVSGVALSSDADRAYVVASGAAMLRGIDLSAGSLLDELALPPVELETWDRSSNGLRALALGEDAIYEIGQAGAVRYTGAIEPLLRSAAAGGQWLAGRPDDVAAQKSPRRLEATNSGWVYVEDAGRIWRESLMGGVRTPVLDARTSSIVRLGQKGGWDASPDGEAIYVANGAGELARMSSDPQIPVRTVALLEAGGAVEAVTPRVEQTGTLGLATPDSIVVAGGTQFQITVKATDSGGEPQADVPVFLSNRFPAEPTASCITALTDSAGEAVMDCVMGEVTTPVVVQLTFSDTRGRSAPIVSVQSVVPTEFEGLALLSEDGVRIALDTEFPIVVQVSRARVPVANASLGISLDPPRDGPLTCPRSAQSGPDGRATFACRSVVDLEEAESVEFTIRDGSGNEVTGAVIVDPSAVAPTGLTKVSGDGAVIPQGETVELVVSSFRDGAPRARTTLNITVLEPGQPPVLTCPLNARTNDEGIARFTCRSGTLFGGRRSVFVQVSDFGRLLPEPFEIIVTASTFGFPQNLVFITEEDLRIPAGRPVLNAIRVRSVDDRGDPVQNSTVYFTQLSPGELTLDPEVVKTGEDGIAATTVTVGCNPDPVVVGVSFDPETPLIDLEVRPEGGAFAKMVKLQGDGQSGAPGQPLNAMALVAQTSDECGLPVTQQQVTWRVKPAFAATLRATVSTSDSRGRVSTLVTLGQYGGPFEIEVGTGQAVTSFTLAVNLPASELRAVSGGGQIVSSGQAAEQPLVAQALGANGFGVSDVPITWSVVEGPATITQSQTITGAAGIAFARVRVGGAGGPRVRVQASALGQTASFELNSTDGPQATAAGFANGASFQTGWTLGGTGSIFGVALAEQLVSATSTPFPTTLGGVTVRLNGTPVPIIFVSPGQINVQVPFEAAVGQATVEIDNNGRLLMVSGVEINAVQPGVFVISVEGQTIAAVLHQDGSLVTPSSPAIPGEVLQLFFTGAGALSPAVMTNQPGPADPLPFTVEPVVVKVDGVVQEGFGSFYAPGLITANQVNFRLGGAEQAGNRNLELDMNGVVSNTVTLPVGAAAALTP